MKLKQLIKELQKIDELTNERDVDVLIFNDNTEKPKYKKLTRIARWIGKKSVYFNFIEEENE